MRNKSGKNFDMSAGYFFAIIGIVAMIFGIKMIIAENKKQERREQFLKNSEIM